jgi:ectoine hydroxylase
MLEMPNTADLRARYETDGFALLPGVLGPAAREAIHRAAARDLVDDSPRRVLEKDGHTVRATHGGHLYDPVLAAVCRHPVLLGSARALLAGEVYVHQFKINQKRAARGERWEWHQDFVFWREEDGMRQPRCVNAAVFLDDVDERNGPLMLVRGSHRLGVLDPAKLQDVPAGYGGQPDWIGNLTAELRYTVPGEVVRTLAHQHEVVSATAPAGSLLLFHPDVVHGSSANLSDRDRTLMIVTYNHVDNAPGPVPNPRPEFLCARDSRPLRPLSPSELEPLGLT